MNKESVARILFLDIETTNLSSDFGYILCASWKWQGNPRLYTAVITDSPDFKKDPTNDRYVAEEARKAVESADILVTWYGSRFDVPYLNSKLLLHGLDVIPPVPHVDGWVIARKKMKLHSNRLASVSAFLGEEEKTPLDGKTWIRAMAGNCKAIKYVVKHCEQDVRVLEEVYNRIRSLATSHPNVGLVRPYKGKPQCPVCGSIDMQKRGYGIKRACVHQRYQCQSCGAWSQGKPENVGIEVR